MTPDAHTARVAVVGLGKIGLPLAVQFARRGFDVIGIDIDRAVVDGVNAGRAPFPGEAHLEDYLEQAVASGRLVASDDTVSSVARCSVVVIVVPLIVDGAGVPEFTAMDAATRSVGAGLQPGTLVLYETTLPVFTTRRRFTPALEAASGLRAGEDLFVAFSPERVYSGRIFADLRRYPKLVGGLDSASTERAMAFYAAALEFDERPDLDRPNGVWDLGSAEAAELSKLAETTYRDINIGFANELALFSQSAGIDVFGVIAAANSQPFSHIHQPGIAVGGHCIPVYPKLFLSNAPDAQTPAAARRTNEAVPARVVALVAEQLGGLTGTTVVVLGAAYRGGVKETAFSGVFALVDALRAAGARPVVHDPLYSDDELRRLGFEPHHLGEPVDAAIIQADHEMYAHLAPGELPGVRLLFDGRHLTTADAWLAAGVIHRQLGVAPDQ